jgi:aspartate aminotransferase-like enzyme
MLPGPTNVPDRIMRAMIKPIMSHRGPEFSALHGRIRENLKQVFQTNQDVFVLTSSSTGAVECAIGNMVNPGDKIIIPLIGDFSDRIKNKIVRHGGKPVEIPINWGEAPTATQIESVVKKEKDAKAIAIVYNETSTGVTVRDLPEIGRIAAENNMLLMVDAVSVLGGDNLPVDKWNIDFCAAGSQKCLACPPGLAMVAVSKKAWEVVEKTVARPYYFDLVSMRNFDSRNETPSTPALPLYHALDEALKMLLEEGLENSFKRHATCAKAFYASVEALKLKPFSAEKVRSNTVVAVNLPEKVDGAKLREILKDRYKVVVAGGQGKISKLIFRIGSMGIISEAIVLTTINALENTLADLNYPIRIGAGTEAARQFFH